MSRSWLKYSAALTALLSGCVMIPTAPMVTALPGSTKGFDEFRYDDADCRNYAYSMVAGPSQAATNTAAANAAVGTAVGAAAGAIIGSASGNAGSGAAIGAGTGLLFGSTAGANGLYYSSYGLQRQYDSAYIQCMYAKGNRVPARFYTGDARPYSLQPSPQTPAPSRSPSDPDGAPRNSPPSTAAPPRG